MSTDRRLIERLASEPSPRRRPTAVVVDWDEIGKRLRQRDAAVTIGFDTTIRPDPCDAIALVRRAGIPTVVCRVNALGRHTREEVAAAHEQGATAVLLPMWRTPADLETLLDIVDDRLMVGVMVETPEAVANVRAVPALGIDFAFVGLVDLAIERRTPSIFAPISDGTLDRIAEGIDGVPFGFGGLTLPDLGSPLPNRLLVGEMLRLGAAFSFMRRSFVTDLGDGEPGPAIAAIRDRVDELARRTTSEVLRDRREIVALVDGLAVAS